jgi:hypothetical protein
VHRRQHRQPVGVQGGAEVAKYVDNTPNLSARSYAILCVNKKMSLDEQAGLVKDERVYKRQRDAYNSLFLANFREIQKKATLCVGV